MSEEKQLTVAELLARAAAEGRPTSSGKRRRRRSVEEGGISVAELTGSIPKVDRKPIESRHSSVPIDEDDPQQESKVHASALINKAEPKAADTVEPKDDEKPESVAPTAAPSTDVSRGTATDTESDAPSVEDTAQLSPVKVPEKTPGASAGPTDASRSDLGSDLDSTATIPVVSDAHAPTPAVKTPSPATPDLESPAVTQQATESAVPATASDREIDFEDADDDEESSGSMFSVILMAVVGIVLGLVVFIGFDLLWDHLDKRIVAVLALAVTAAHIAIVHALRTAKDRLSMALAGIVGLLMTFGPLLIKILQR